MTMRSGLFRAWIALSVLWAVYRIWRTPLSCPLATLGWLPTGDEYCGLGRLANPIPFYWAVAVQSVGLPALVLLCGIAVHWIFRGFRTRSAA